MSETIVRPGWLVRTKVSEKWGSGVYWNERAMEWQELPPGTAGLVTGVGTQKIQFIANGEQFSIHNCYNDPDSDGVPAWCDIVGGRRGH